MSNDALPAEARIEASGTAPPGRFAAFDAVVSWLLGVSLVCSSIPHLDNPYFFVASVYRYRLVGPWIGQIVAMTLPFLQAVLAACLIAGLFRNAGHAITLAMLVIFAAVQTSAKLRGLDISCGCFGPRHETAAIGWFTLSVVYGLLLLAVARLVGYWWSARTAKHPPFEGEEQTV